jgi:hypothetical protein
MKMMGGGSADMQEAMKNPSIQNLLKNPEMIKQSVEMLKTNPAMLDMLKQQMPGVDPNTLLKALDWMGSLAGYYASTRNMLSNKTVQSAVLILVLVVVFWYFG